MADERPPKQMTRKQRKELGRRLWSTNPGLEVVHRDAAGIDIGGREHYAAVGPDRDAEPVRSFGCFTADIHRMAEWFQACGVRTVVMQSTGVYWIPVFDILEQHGFEVWLVNARETRNLPGRKSDVQESQWLLKLHTYGLLRKSFRPPAEIRGIRSCWRERAEYVQQAGVCVQRMQKALTEMNVQLSTVLSDLSGVTGMKIIRAILAGERDGRKLAAFRDPNVKASEEQIARSLEGTWIPEQLAILKRQVEDWDHIQKQIGACDLDLALLLEKMPTAEAKPARVKPARASSQALPLGEKKGKRVRKKASKNQPNFDLATALTRVAGVDLTRIDGIQPLTVQTLISEAGLDMSPWETEDQFVSWIGLAPSNDTSGGRVIRRKTRKVVSRLATALRMAATTLRLSDSYLGAQFRRFRSRLGAPKAITAMAAKLARLIYRMLKYGEAYVDRGAAYYEEALNQQRLKQLTKQAARQGFALVPMAELAQNAPA
jgi:transposase